MQRRIASAWATFKAGMTNPITGLPIERVGTTGSREGPVSVEQAGAAEALLKQMWPFKELHHGACVGWDEWVVVLARELWGPYTRGGVQIHAWPPTKRKLLSPVALRMSDVAHEAREYKARDRELVWHTQALVGGPKQWGEILHSGSWYTMRQALAMVKPIWFVRADGEVITNWKSEMNERATQREMRELAAHPFDLNDVSMALFNRVRESAHTDLDEAFTPDPHGDLDEAFS
jgi:hypothetical protein